MSDITDSLIHIDQARYHAMAKIWPALYLALAGDVFAEAFVHAAYAPWWLWAPLPAVLVPKALLWAFLWFRKRNHIPPREEAVRQVRWLGIEITIWMCLIIGWELALSHYGGIETLGLLMLSLAGQMVFILFGLMQLGAWSVISAVLCMGGFFYVVSRTGGFGYGAATLVLSGVGGLIIVAIAQYNDFTRLVNSRSKIAAQTLETERLSAENLRLAETDMLTEIGNRRLFFSDLKRRSTAGTLPQLAVGIADLDGFKSVNDSIGHVIGDRLLKAVAERLRDSLGSDGTVYRLGGDEFALILHDTTSNEALMAIGTRLIEHLSTPFHLGGITLTVGCSIGFAVADEKTNAPEDLYENADYALFHAKDTGRGKTVIFDEGHAKTVREAAQIERALRDADLENELFLMYQPIVDTAANRTLLLECLARWVSPTLGFISPGLFIPIAEQAGLVSNLTYILLKKALTAAKQWPETVGISFNLSGHDISNPERMMKLIALVEASGVNPKRIDFEVTETALMLNMERGLQSLNLLKALGSRISLDDFGTGYSSLSQIQKLPLDKIKVDASFVRNLDGDVASEKIIRSINALTRDLSLGCVVEGVETEDQLTRLREIGCSLIQGYYYSRPLKVDAVDSFLAEGLGTVAA